MPGRTQVIREGWNGRLVPPGDAAAIAAAVEDLLGEPELARTMGARNRAMVERELSLKRVVEAYAGVYLEVLGHSSLVM
jgi:glycosyltransferase involved in cell wall biosynthesis